MAFDALIIQALSLSERKRYAARIPLRSDRSHHLDACKQWFEPPRWFHFLKETGLREADLLGLAHATAFRSRSVPPWAVTLRSLMNNLRSAPSRNRPKCSLTESLASPLVRFAWRELSENVSMSRLRLLSSVVQSTLRKSLATRLERTVKQVAEWESRVAREGFLDQGSESQLFELLQQYPALARLWSQQVRNWIKFTTDFLDHTERLLNEIDGDGVRSRTIRSIVPDISDPHRGNRTVFKVHFSRSGVWYYKPRTGAAECGWSALLEWFNENGFPQHFKTLEVISRKDHCWMKAVPVRSCRSVEEVAAFFFRGGALLYLIHLLRGCDFHAGNLIAHGAQPVVIDCETLRHPATRLPRAARRREKDVLRTGLLPAGETSEELIDDVSAFGRETTGSHRLRHADRPVFARDFVEDLVSGFTAMHEFLRHRESEFHDVAEKFLPDRCRCLYRPTIHYEAILEASLAPRILMNGLVRTLFLQASCRNGSVAHRHVEQEVTALENADIPQFTCGACSVRRIPRRSALNESVALIRDSLRKPTV